MLDAVARGWENFIARPDGPLNVRFILQPAMATLIAIRAGLQDARGERPAFFWALLTTSGRRQFHLRDGWKDLRTIFFVAVVLDVVYQYQVHRRLFLIELLFTATLLAVVPYVLIRGPVNRVAQLFSRRSQRAPR
jgi:hypothetical protein